jgi:HAD superfamily hydrolase (TIGR01509 family)
MIKAILFDIGGVLVQTVDTTPRQRWEQRLGLPAWGLSAHVFDNAYSQAAFIGKADAPEIWAFVSARLGVPEAERETLARDFWAGDALNPQIYALALGLREKFKTGILSNAWHDMRLRDARRIDFTRFDSVVYSCQEGVRKPDPRSFEIALTRLGAQPQETVFIDDFAENIAAAAALGLHTVHYRAGLELAAELARIDPRLTRA